MLTGQRPFIVKFRPAARNARLLRPASAGSSGYVCLHVYACAYAQQRRHKLPRVVAVFQHIALTSVDGTLSNLLNTRKQALLVTTRTAMHCQHYCIVSTTPDTSQAQVGV